MRCIPAHRGWTPASSGGFRKNFAVSYRLLRLGQRFVSRSPLRREPPALGLQHVHYPRPSSERHQGCPKGTYSALGCARS
jgi:hypothetical protein